MLLDENRIQYETVISEINSNEIICEIKDSYQSQRDLDFDLYLAQSPLRSDAQLTIMEKATELGVRGVYPVITDNCALAKSVLDKNGIPCTVRLKRGIDIDAGCGQLAAEQSN